MTHGDGTARIPAGTRVDDAVAEILRREGVEILFGYPVNPIIEAAARGDIRPIIVRQERIGLHMADAYQPRDSGERIGVFAMQHGPGTENAFGGVAQAYGDRCRSSCSRPATHRRRDHVRPQLQRATSTSSTSPSRPSRSPRARTCPTHAARVHAGCATAGRGPVAGRDPGDVWTRRCRSRSTIDPRRLPRSAPDPEAVARAARGAGRGRAARHLRRPGRPLRARPGRELRELAELLGARSRPASGARARSPRTTARRSAPAAARSRAGRSLPRRRRPDLRHRLQLHRDRTSASTMPAGKTIIHATLDPTDLNKDVPVELALVGDAKLTLDALLGELASPARRTPRGRARGRRRDRARARARGSPSGGRSSPRTRCRSTPYRVICATCAHGRRRQHDHHPRRRQPARPALAVLGAHDAAVATSAGARPRSSATASGSRWAPSSPTPTSSASTSGATPRSASPAWTSRPRCASGSRSSRSCSTTSRWRSSCQVMPVSTEQLPRRPTSAATTRDGARVRRLRRAGHRARRDRARDPARHRSRPRRRAGAARVHHLEGGRALALPEVGGQPAAQGTRTILPAGVAPLELARRRRGPGRAGTSRRSGPRARRRRRGAASSASTLGRWPRPRCPSAWMPYARPRPQ